MEDHQQFEKAVFEFRHKKFRSARVFRNRQKKTRFGVSMNHYEEIFCYYGLRVNPKKTQKSPDDDRLGTRKKKKKKKRLIRCEECEKGFLYEKCLLKHREMMHSLNQKKRGSEECMRKDLLCSFSDVKRRKRSKRVSRYKKSLRISVSSSSSSSFTNFPASEGDGELLEVAETLILLSKSGEALEELKVGFLRNKQKLVAKFTEKFLSNEVRISTKSDGKLKEIWGLLGDDDESDQQKQVAAGSFREEVGLERVSLEDYRLQNAETDVEQRLLGCQETGFEDSDSGKEGFQMNNEHRCRVCDRVFTTYQALGGHQTFHRARNKS